MARGLAICSATGKDGVEAVHEFMAVTALYRVPLDSTAETAYRAGHRMYRLDELMYGAEAVTVHVHLG